MDNWLNTGYGRKLMEADIPAITKALKDIAKELNELNKNIKELKGNEKV